MNFTASNLRRLRCWYGITSAQLSGYLGVTELVMVEWESGIAVPDLVYRRKLSTLFEICQKDICYSAVSVKYRFRISRWLRIHERLRTHGVKQAIDAGKSLCREN